MNADAIKNALVSALHPTYSAIIAQFPALGELLAERGERLAQLGVRLLTETDQSARLELMQDMGDVRDTMILQTDAALVRAETAAKESLKSALWGIATGIIKMLAAKI